jgi:tRNA 2-thiocytidine biosynthesis protein TtcA
LSGGKDSWSLLFALDELRKKAPVNFELKAFTIIPTGAMADTSAVEERLRSSGISYEFTEADLIGIINENLTAGTNPCSFCARLRRGILYTRASLFGFNKIALGHHLDDAIETLLMNMFFNGSIKGMSPSLRADDGKNHVIRPMIYVKEEITRESAKDLDVPIVNCLCTYGGMTSARRKWVKKLIDSIELEVPDVRTNLLSSMGRVHDRHLLKTTIS